MLQALDEERAQLIRQTAHRYREQFPDKDIDMINERLKGFVDGLLHLQTQRSHNNAQSGQRNLKGV